ncbi:MAG TPA: hypothetical protein ENG66_04795 [Thermococcus sp.]|nr:hypothetical protein [Thermococcus sp.]
MAERIFTLRHKDSQDLSASALSTTTSFNRRFRLLWVHLKASTGLNETVTVTFKSKNGSNYDVPLESKDLGGADSYTYIASRNEVFETGDEVQVTCTNSGGTGIVYVEVLVQDLGKY